jgi:lysophospholipid acyltransferase (LPLAT)-like uncharacterized protein
MSSFWDRLQLAALPWLAAKLIRFIHFAVKPETVGDADLLEVWESGQKVIFCTWHDQLLMMPPRYKGTKAQVLISPSRDGELIARTIAYFSLGAVRGSSSRGGREAFRKLVAFAREPVDLGITPDGPKGPRHEAKIGVVQLARMTGHPIVPLAFACSHGHRFKSWDRFLLPYPWGKAVYQVGQPLSSEKSESAEAFLVRVQQAMEDNTCQAGEYLKHHDLSAV